MINELLEAEGYINGENINKEYTYRTCYLIAKYYLAQGKSALETRELIFEWANRHSVYISSSLSGIVYKASVDGVVPRGETDVFISDGDIEEIKRRFDTKNTRMVALALLCYGKACADQNGECSLSTLALANWIGMNRGNMLNRCMPQMYGFSFISQVKPKYRWDRDGRDKMTHIRFEVPLVNEGKYRLEDNNIAKLFSEIF